MIRKICFASSSGGHLEEISRLKELKNNYECFLVTEESDFGEVDFCDKVYYINQIMRSEKWFYLHFGVLIFKSLRILLKENPDCIISTGALATYPLCIIGKIFRKKIIYIESFARVNEVSMTGKLMKKVADIYIVQWEKLLEFIPDAVYGGSIF